MRHRLIAALAIVFGITQVFSVFAQNSGKTEDLSVRSVEGSVTGSGGAVVEGAVVQLKNTKTLQVRSFITQKDGKYHFQGLSTNADYELKAVLGEQSSKTKTLSSFDSRKTATIDLKIESKT
jgi:hypothetical protein